MVADVFSGRLGKSSRSWARAARTALLASGVIAAACGKTTPPLTEAGGSSGAAGVAGDNLGFGGLSAGGNSGGSEALGGGSGVPSSSAGGARGGAAAAGAGNVAGGGAGAPGTPTESGGSSQGGEAGSGQASGADAGGAAGSSDGAAKAPVFRPQVSYRSSGGRYRFVVTSDLNGDGALDLAVTKDMGGLDVLLNRGDGSFTAPTNYKAGSSPYIAPSIASADLNGDGAPDLAVWNDEPSDGRDVSVLMNVGDGTFAPFVGYESGRAAAETENGGFVAADFNGDHAIDLATGGGTLLPNDGTGKFEKIGVFGAPGNGGVAAGDLDGDGDTDLVLTKLGALQVLLNEGNETFRAPLSLPVTGEPQSVAIADLNGDKALDLVTTIHSPAEVRVFWNSGVGTFADSSAYPLAPFAWSAGIGDLNGDGSPDLALPAYDATTGVRVLVNDGHGAFSPADSFLAGPYPVQVASADLNGDGKQDLVVVNRDSNDVSVLLNAMP